MLEPPPWRCPREQQLEPAFEAFIADRARVDALAALLFLRGRVDGRCVRAEILLEEVRRHRSGAADGYGNVAADDRDVVARPVRVRREYQIRVVGTLSLSAL